MIWEDPSHLLPACKMRRLVDPFSSVIHLQCFLGHGAALAGLVVGTIIKVKLGLQPKPLGVASYRFWQGDVSIVLPMLCSGSHYSLQLPRHE